MKKMKKIRKNDTVVMLRVPKALKVQIEEEAKEYGISSASLIRKKMERPSELADKPLIRIVRGRLKDADLLKVEIPIEKGLKVRGKKKKVPI